jgi:hypothetical protein
MRPPAAFALLACVAAVSGCAATTYAHRSRDHQVRDAIGKPFRDAGWMREHPPEVLIRAAKAPYAQPNTFECDAVLHEIAALDLVLGPDLDVAGPRAARFSESASALLSGAIGGAIGLPYRGVVRRISGAEARERDLKNAVFAGMVRRAFLKGLARSSCASDAPAAQPGATASAAQPAPSATGAEGP